VFDSIQINSLNDQQCETETEREGGRERGRERERFTRSIYCESQQTHVHCFQCRILPDTSKRKTPLSTIL